MALLVVSYPNWAIVFVRSFDVRVRVLSRAISTFSSSTPAARRSHSLAG